jgi:hypothetical protein
MMITYPTRGIMKCCDNQARPAPGPRGQGPPLGTYYIRQGRSFCAAIRASRRFLSHAVHKDEGWWVHIHYFLVGWNVGFSSLPWAFHSFGYLLGDQVLSEISLKEGI